MRIADRYERFLDRVGPSGAKGAEQGKPPANAAVNRDVLDVKVSERAQELSASSIRVEELRAAVQSGAFKVDPQRIAKLLVGGDDE